MKYGMKIYLLILVLCAIQFSSFAQKSGIDLSLFYTLNTFKHNVHDDRLNSLKMDLWQPVPNISIRPYFHLQKNLYLYTGVDLNYYLFKETFEWGDNTAGNYKKRIEMIELHIPVMLRWQIRKAQNENCLFLYGGAFARFTAWKREQTLLYDNGTYSKADALDNVLSIEKNGKQYLNFLAGAHQTFGSHRKSAFYADFQIKYITGSYYSPSTMYYRYLPVRIKNSFSFTFAIGISLFKAEKKQISDPSRLED